jgi:hypothetical protein
MPLYRAKEPDSSKPLRRESLYPAELSGRGLRILSASLLVEQLVAPGDRSVGDSDRSFAIQRLDRRVVVSEFGRPGVSQDADLTSGSMATDCFSARTIRYSRSCVFG